VKISTLQALFQTHLSPLYEKREIDAIFFIYIEDKYNIKKHDYFLNFEMEEGRHEGAKGRRHEWRKDLEELSRGCPIQYIIGKTTFYGLELNVNPDVLIPRSETEELVEHILMRFRVKRGMTRGCHSALDAEFQGIAGQARNDEGRGSLYKILDLATGSGTIAIALAKNIKNATVWATDISEKALETAKKNAAENNVAITFLHHNILKDDITLLPDNLDIIVSNPPYIPQSEQKHLHKNVVDYEPKIALFVPNENPLIFYDAIVKIAKKILREGGSLYFETHEKFHAELSAMLAEMDFKEIELWNDINGKPRFISCKKL